MKHRYSSGGEESGPTRVRHATRSDTLRYAADTSVGECPIFYYFFRNVDTRIGAIDTRIGSILQIKIKTGAKFEIMKSIKIKNKNKKN